MPSQQIVQEVLRPYHHRIRRIVEQAWAEWRQVDKFRLRKGYGAVLYPRTLANFVFDAIARNAFKEFAGDTSVTVVAEAQTVKFVFKGEVIGRFKKGGEDGMGSNQPTLAVLAYVDSQQVLPGLPPETAKVEFVWRANEIATHVDSVKVIARHNDSLLWEYEITSLSATVTQLPTAAVDAGSDDLVKLKSRPGRKDKGK